MNLGEVMPRREQAIRLCSATRIQAWGRRISCIALAGILSGAGIPLADQSYAQSGGLNVAIGFLHEQLPEPEPLSFV